jgi:hypothetical protein
MNFPAYNNDRDSVIGSALNEKTWIINAGTQRDTSKSAVDLANKYERGVYATVGLHPIHGGGSTYHDKNELSDSEYDRRSGEWDYEFYKELVPSVIESLINILVIALVIAVSSIVLTDFQSTTTAASYAYNASGDGLTALDNVSNQLGTVGTIVIAAILLGLIITAFVFFTRR